MDTLSFRESCLPSDILAVGRILRDCGFFNEAEQEVGVSLVTERLEKGLDSGYFFMFAEQNGHVVGYTCFGPIPGTASSYDLYWIAVSNELRGKGIGTVLITTTEEKIKHFGGTRVYVETSSKEIYVPTRNFYESNNYVLEASLKDYYGPEDDKLMYVKVL